jgi:Domain of unknown function (DUF4265)
VATNEKQEMVKVGFKLDRDQDDYPPADWEWMWASRVGESTFKIDNSPFFAKGISAGDIVAAEQTNGGLVFRDLIQPSGHSTVRVVVFRGDRNEEQVRALIAELRESLKALGCSTELSHIPNLFSVDIPPEVHYSSVSAFLSQKEAVGILEYEEACVA